MSAGEKDEHEANCGARAGVWLIMWARMVVKVLRELSRSGRNFFLLSLSVVIAINQPVPTSIKELII